ncbi:MAG: hypothetical protein ACM3YO_00885 [Bacteroidota bacterium]
MHRESMLGILLAMSLTACASPATMNVQQETNPPAVSQPDTDLTKPVMEDEKAKVEQMEQNPLSQEELQRQLPQRIEEKDAEKMLTRLDSGKIAETPDSSVSNPESMSSEDQGYSTQQRRGWRGRVYPYRYSRFGYRNIFHPYYNYSYSYYRPLYYYPVGSYYYPYYYYDGSYYPYYYNYGSSYYYPYYYYTGRYYRPYYYTGRNLWWRSGYLGRGYGGRWGGRGWSGRSFGRVGRR